MYKVSCVVFILLIIQFLKIETVKSTCLINVKRGNTTQQQLLIYKDSFKLRLYNSSFKYAVIRLCESDHSCGEDELCISNENVSSATYTPANPESLVFAHSEMCNSTNNYKVDIQFHCENHKFAYLNSVNYETCVYIISLPSANCKCLYDIESTEIRLSLDSIPHLKCSKNQSDCSLNFCENEIVTSCTNNSNSAFCKLGKQIVNGTSSRTMTYSKNALSIHYYNDLFSGCTFRELSSHLQQNIKCFAEDGNLSAEQICCGTRYVGKTVLNCAENDTGVVELTLANENEFVFNVNTSLACVNIPDCKITDDLGYTHDLSVLRNTIENWSITSKNGTIYFNICSRLIPSPPLGLYDCTKENAFACIVESGNEIILSKSQEKLYYSENVCHLQYGEDVKCGTSVSKFKILFECSLIQEEPTFKFNEPCNIVMNWKTPTVCSKAYNVGYDCRVEDNFFSKSKFDFNKLRVEKSDYIVELQGKEQLRINLCGPLANPCDKENEASICYTTKDGASLTIGHTNHSVIFENGIMRMVFSGPSCRPDGFKRNSTVQIYFQCDPSVEPSKPIIDKFDTKNCIFNLNWTTSVACPPSIKKECKPEENDNILLNSLMKNKNYEVSDSKNKNTVIFNVCQSLIYSPNALCDKTAAVCLTDNSKLNIAERFISIGDINTMDLHYEENMSKVVIDYESKLINKRRYHISVNFLCNETYYQSPSLRNFSKYNYTITLPSPDVCNLSNTSAILPVITQSTSTMPSTKSSSTSTSVAPTPTKPTPIIDHTNSSLYNCSVKSPYTNQTITFTRDHPIVVPYNNRVIEIGVCGPIPKSDCGAGVGVCDTTSKINYGIANSKLMYRKGGPYLIYSVNNSRCNFITIIEFVCADESKLGSVVDKVNCSMIIQIPTDAVCEKKYSCEVQTPSGENITLSYLTNNNNNYRLQVPQHLRHKTSSNVLFINVCRPLTPVESLSCGGGSAACSAIKTDNSLIREMSLGYPDESPIIDKNKKIVLKYMDGSYCSGTKDTNLSSIIVFNCDLNAGRGYPVLANIEDCKYIFHWNTLVVCKSIEGHFNNDKCIISNQQFDKSLDLRTVKADRKEKNITLCDLTFDYHQVFFNYSKHLVQLKYIEHRKSCNSYYVKDVHLKCNLEAGLGSPKITTPNNCSIHYEWETSIVCDLLGLSPKKSEVKEADYSAAITISVLVIIFATVVIGLAFVRKEWMRWRIRSAIHNCLERRRTRTNVTYSRALDEEDSEPIMMRHYAID